MNDTLLLMGTTGDHRRHSQCDADDLQALEERDHHLHQTAVQQGCSEQAGECLTEGAGQGYSQG